METSLCQLGGRNIQTVQPSTQAMLSSQTCWATRDSRGPYLSANNAGNHLQDKHSAVSETCSQLLVVQPGDGAM